MFIGPNSKAIAAMGDKLTSKKIAVEAKVNTVPGYNGVLKVYIITLFYGYCQIMKFSPF